MIVAFRIAIGREGTGRYVLGNGSLLGADNAPAPGGVGVESCRGADCVWAAGACTAAGAGAARPVAQPIADAIAASITWRDDT